MKANSIWICIITIFLSFTVSGQNIVNFRNDLSGNRMQRKIDITRIHDTLKSEIKSSVNINSEIVDNIKVYPNPMSDHINIDLPEIMINTEYFLFDQNSKLILKGILISEESVLDVTGLKKGSYILRIIYDNLNCSFKIIKN
jgi:hypothetical protein